ncbi:protein adenylyltransferase SelO [Hahella ganghwensis]|uniref:protein adenylyltransferase SelO n=1 Tax=Hahella ganghwensis TaxID=286420 RepID=UPI00037E42FB|nr:YdiU family protein [Hahella ganghwensis]
MTDTPIPFDNRYVQLPERFFSHEQPTPVDSPNLIRANPRLAAQLGIDPQWFATKEVVEVFSGNSVPSGAEPISTVYAGHQFGNWNPQLGDGRAILIGEVVDQQGQRYDIQLKGSGQTPFSRMGDGRSPLGPVLREYIVSEAMASFGIPTTRSLVAVTTGEPVIRESVLPGAILTRIARSHIRVGHFQYFSARQDLEAVQLLAEHLIARDFPDIQGAANPYIALLEQSISRQAELIAKWQLIGFIHGVMNTDNMLVNGDTIDYGPCAFMDNFHPETCFSSIDHRKRYAYRNQPAIGQWNLSWLAQALLPWLDSDTDKGVEIARELLGRYVDDYQEAYQSGLHQKFGLNEVSKNTVAFTESFLDMMSRQNADFTLTFRHLSDIAAGTGSSQHPVYYQLPDHFTPLLNQWRELRKQQGTSDEEIQRQIYAVNPAFIPRNHLVEEAINEAQRTGDLRLFHRLVDVLENPFSYDPENSDMTQPPEPHQVVRQTFCGT